MAKTLSPTQRTLRALRGREEVKALRRLVKKGYATEEKNGRRAVWRPRMVDGS